jgi:hypothetical protein
MPKKKSKRYTYRKYEYDHSSITVGSNIRERFDALRKKTWDEFINKTAQFIEKNQKAFDEFEEEELEK